jgi:hypothetical protein
MSLIAPERGSGCDAITREQYRLLVRLPFSPRDAIPTEAQFIEAMTKHLRRTRRQFPCWADTVDVARSIRMTESN